MASLRTPADRVAGKASVIPAHPAPTDLDTRIALAENAVIERDRRVQHGAHEVAERLRANWPVALGVTLAVAFLLGRMVAHRHHGAARPTSPLRSAIGPDGPIWRTLPLLWPLMPKDLRDKVPSGTVALLSNIAATLTGGLRPGKKG